MIVARLPTSLAALIALCAATPAHAQNAALIYDTDPFGYGALEGMLDDVGGIPYTVVGSADLPTFDPWLYTMIFVASGQEDPLYAAWNARLDDISAWVADGGFLAVHACIHDCDLATGDVVPALPGGQPITFDTYGSRAEVVGPADHPLLGGLPPGPFLSYTTLFVDTGDPADVVLLVDSVYGGTMLFHRAWGRGNIAYGGIAYEWGYVVHNPFPREDGAIIHRHEVEWGATHTLCSRDDTDADGVTECDGDCAVDDPSVSPEAAETVGDGVDQDCDALDLCYEDLDLDGHGGIVLVPGALGCAEPGVVGTSTDCDDGSELDHPGADEVCDDLDNDCDGLVDDDDPERVGGSTFFADGDDDGFGDAAATAVACLPPHGHVATNSDCDDSRADVHPEAAEAVCNDLDDDCDGASADWLDTDLDGVCETLDACAGHDDLLDGDGDGAADGCDPCPVDPLDDSDGDTVCDSDDACRGADDRSDADGDAVADACDSCPFVVGVDADLDTYCPGEDCDDGDPDVHPAADELCNALDDDCDGLVDADDSDLLDAGTWWPDSDLDGFGDVEGAPAVACEPPDGWTGTALDCDDEEPAVHPDAVETCNNVDDDCDDLVDDEDGAVTGAPDWYADADADGFGDAGDVLAACAQPTGRVESSSDCDDGDDGVHPGAIEICNDRDDDCDGPADDEDPDGVTGVSTWYGDGDGDGFGDAEVTIESCEQGSGFVADGTDCDDSEPSVHPAATETAGDGIDQDCDGVDDPLADVGEITGHGCACTSARTSPAPWVVLAAGFLVLRRRVRTAKAGVWRPSSGVMVVG